MEWDGTLGSIKEVATNNLYYYIQEFIVAHRASLALLVIGLFLAFMTFLKTGAYFLSSATIIPIDGHFHSYFLWSGRQHQPSFSLPLYVSYTEPSRHILRR